MRTLVAALLVLSLTALGQAATIQVPSNHMTIQAAIQAADTGDTILVAAGTYVENLDFLGKDLVLKSESGPLETVIDGNHGASVVTIKNGETAAALLEGFTLTNGHAAYVEGGGAVSCLNGSCPVIRGNLITLNDVGGALGGGVFCSNSSPLIQGNVFSKNASGMGGAISCRYGAAPHILDNVMEGNQAGQRGGAIECYQDGGPVIERNLMKGNTTYSTWAYGGAVFGEQSAASVLANTIRENDAAHSGGGVYFQDSTPVIRDNVVIGNSTANYGGGIALVGCSVSEVTGCIVAKNAAGVHGGGIYTWYSSQVDITGCTIAYNTAGTGGGGLNCGAWCGDTVLNTILWGNSAPQGKEIRVGEISSPGHCSVDYGDVDRGQAGVSVEGGLLTWGPFIYTADPLFAEKAGEDFHLLPYSPLRDKGDPSVAGSA